jgi:hypothetical protein
MFGKISSKLVVGKTGVCECGYFMDFYPSLKMHTHLDIKHLHAGWVTDAARIHGD